MADAERCGRCEGPRSFWQHRTRAEFGYELFIEAERLLHTFAALSDTPKEA